MAKIWVFAEVNDGKVDTAALEILTKARELGGELEAVALGPGSTDAAKELGRVRRDDRVRERRRRLRRLRRAAAAHALHELVKEHSPELVLFATNYDSRDIAGRLSGRTGSTLMSNCFDVLGTDKARTTIFGGATVVDVALEGTPKIALVRPKSFEPEASGGEATVVPVEVDIPDDLKKAKRVERHEEASDRTEARRGSGRHLRRPGSAGGFELRASRPAGRGYR